MASACCNVPNKQFQFRNHKANILTLSPIYYRLTEIVYITRLNQTTEISC